jgi:nuclease S1
MQNAYARKLITCLLGTCCLISLLPAPAMAWGRKGHSIVARIATKHLSQKTQTAILDLLKSDPDDRGHCADKTSLEDRMACIAPWADDVRGDSQYGNTGPFHFVNIPIYLAKSQRHYIESRDCKNGDCIVQAIAKYRGILADQSKSPAERAIALKFIVHFVGDLHQPLHTAKDHDRDAANKENNGKITDNGDQGGNLKLVTWLGQGSYPYGCLNLHSVWDDGMISTKNKDDVTYADALNGAIDAQNLSAIQKGTAIDWANEAFDLAVAHTYKLPKPTAGDAVCQVKVADNKKECAKYDAQACKGAEVHHRYNLGQDYNDSNLPIVESQLKSAGLRLAKLLSDIFEP